MLKIQSFHRFNLISIRVIVACLFGLTTHAVAEEDPTEELPSAEFLEFLADFDGTDDETFELIIHHGKQDLEMQELEEIISQDSEEENNGERKKEV